MRLREETDKTQIEVKKNLGGQSLFGLFHQLFEGFGVPYRYIGQHFPIQLHTGLLETVDKFGVIEAVISHRGVYTGNPEAPHLALSEPAVDILVVEGFHNALFGLSVVLSPTVETFCQFQYFFLSPSGGRSFNTHSKECYFI